MLKIYRVLFFIFLKTVRLPSVTPYNFDVDLLKMSRVMLETCGGF